MDRNKMARKACRVLGLFFFTTVSTGCFAGESMIDVLADGGVFFSAKVSDQVIAGVAPLDGDYLVVPVASVWNLNGEPLNNIDVAGSGTGAAGNGANPNPNSNPNPNPNPNANPNPGQPPHIHVAGSGTGIILPIPGGTGDMIIQVAGSGTGGSLGHEHAWGIVEIVLRCPHADVVIHRNVAGQLVEQAALTMPFDACVGPD